MQIDQYYNVMGKSAARQASSRCQPCCNVGVAMHTGNKYQAEKIVNYK
jgi:hypothetical protein